MFNYIIQNFNLVSFSLALSFFLIISAASRIISNYLVLRRARQNAKAADAKLAELQAQLRNKYQGLRQAIQEQKGDKK